MSRLLLCPHHQHFGLTTASPTSLLSAPKAVIT